MARVICVSNHKGGVGKTTLVANLGFALARHFRVLLVDLDPQANLSSGLGFNDLDENIAKYFKEVIHFRYPTVKPSVINEYVHIIPGSIELLKIENLVRSEYMVKDILNPVKKEYDLILIDCPPAFNLFTINALTSADLILVPAKPEIFSLNGASIINDFASKNNIPIKIIFNQVNSRSLLHRRLITRADNFYHENLVKQTIRDTISLAEGFEHAQDIFHYKRKNLAVQDFIHLSDELLPFI